MICVSAVANFPRNKLKIRVGLFGYIYRWDANAAITDCAMMPYGSEYSVVPAFDDSPLVAWTPFRRLLVTSAGH